MKCKLDCRVRREDEPRVEYRWLGGLCIMFDFDLEGCGQKSVGFFVLSRAVLRNGCGNRGISNRSDLAEPPPLMRTLSW